jgi:hypothetical protein
MKIGSPFPPDGARKRDAVKAEPSGQPRAKDSPGDSLALSESVKTWLGGASDGPQMQPPAETNSAYSEAAVRSKGQVEIELSSEKLIAIQDRIQSGFYNQDAVSRIIAERLSEEIMDSDDSAE